MELRHLRYIAAVAEHGSIAAASRVLHVSQSAISEQIADLADACCIVGSGASG
jgi:DNA-binding transcriptional LysR family regulator